MREWKFSVKGQKSLFNTEIHDNEDGRQFISNESKFLNLTEVCKGWNQTQNYYGNFVMSSPLSFKKLCLMAAF